MLKNIKQTNHRHCERSEAISSRLPRPNGLAMTNETGRSMVEMLGVLAVIGVLSITGISGYTTAMNKHRANEILDAASKRAVVISTQLQSGRTNPTLAEFGEDNTVAGATFSTALETQGSDKFVIKFTSGNEPSAEIWAQMQNIAGTTGIVRAYESGRTGLVYNNDLTTDAKASDYNGNQNGCDTTKYTWCSGSGLCLEGTNQTCTCSGTVPDCKKCDTTTGDFIADSTKAGNDCTTTDSKEGKCNASGTCVETPSDNCPTGSTYDGNATDASQALETGHCTCTSWTTNQCGTGYYCQFSPDDMTVAPTSGVCKNIIACDMGTLGSFKYSHSSDGCSPDWWTAQAICKADGGRTLVSLSNIGCKNSEYNTCTSDILSGIRTAEIDYTFWTIDSAPTDDGMLMAWYVASDNYIGGNGRGNSYGYFQALCQ